MKVVVVGLTYSLSVPRTEHRVSSKLYKEEAVPTFAHGL